MLEPIELEGTAVIRAACVRRVSALVLVGVVAMSPVRAYAQSVAAPEAATSNRGALLPLYVSFAALQVLDVHSTTRAINHGAAEGNGLMVGAAGSPASLAIVKAGGAAATILLAEKVRKRSRIGATLLMAGVNSFYGIVVAHNYRAGSK